METASGWYLVILRDGMRPFVLTHYIGGQMWCYFNRLADGMVRFYSEAAARSAAEVLTAPCNRPTVLNATEIQDLLVMDRLIED